MNRHWGATNPVAPDLGGSYALPPGDHGDRDHRELLAEMIAALYSMVGSAQRVGDLDDDQNHAVRQMLIASGALASSSADAFLVLMSQGLEGPALIHLRSLGEIATRIALCVDNPDLAVALYASWPATFGKLAASLLSGDLKPQAGDKTMQQLERLPQFEAAREKVLAELRLPRDAEAAVNSKRAHGDIYALVAVSIELAKRGPDIRAAINIEQPPGLAWRIHMTRAMGIALVAATWIRKVVGLDDDGRLQALAERYDAMLNADGVRMGYPPQGEAMPHDAQQVDS
jgi:hypothetical protein